MKVLTPKAGMGRGALLSQIEKRNPAIHYGLLKREIREAVPLGFSNELIEYHWGNGRRREITATKSHKFPNNYSFVPVKEEEEFQAKEMFGNDLGLEIQWNGNKDVQHDTFQDSSMFYLSSGMDDNINSRPNGLALLDNDLEGQYVKVDIDGFDQFDSSKERRLERDIDNCKTVDDSSQIAHLVIPSRKSRNALLNGLEKKALAIKQNESSQVVLKIPADFL